MTDATANGAAAGAHERYRSARFRRRLRRRHAWGAVLRLAGIGAIVVALGMLGVLLVSIGLRGYTAFQQVQIRLEVHFDPADLPAEDDGRPTAEALADADYTPIIRDALQARLGEAEGVVAAREMGALVSNGAQYTLRRMAGDDPDLVGERRTVWLAASGDIDMVVKGIVPVDVQLDERQLSDRQLAWLEELRDAGDIRTAFNTDFFTGTTSREPELAGIWGAFVGSMLTLAVTLILAFPVSVLAAVYLEEFAPKNRWTEMIEININNLAAVPSIIFGLLGLAVFLNVFDLPRSSPLAGGVVLALMTLPIVIISARSALRSVPPAYREAARQLGASPQQVVAYSVLPVAMPGILTGTIIGMAQALGETAPLLLMGMVAFVNDVPNGFTDAATVLPVQIYLWAESAERGFVEKTAAGILVLLAVLVTMNAAAIYLRQRLQKRG